MARHWTTPTAGAARIDTNAAAQEARGGGGYERSRRLRRYAVMLATLFVLTTVDVLAQPSAQTDTRPNILVFLSDDMGWGQPGFNGGTEVATPNMDRLANEGVKLTQFYVQPVCSPTRASLMTGRYAWKNSMELRPEYAASNGMLLDERTIAEALRDAGYATWMVGKWHLGQWRQEHLPLQRGFDHHYGFYSARVDSFTLRRGVILDWHRNGRPVVESGYSTFLLADEAVQLIERHDGNRPFFLSLAFGAVHVPYDAPDEYILEYLHLSDSKQRAMLAAMDVAMGQVIDALDRKGALDNTLIVFLNDNGGFVEAGGNEPYRGLKGSYFEGGIRVPAALRWPGHIPSGSESDALLHVVDLFPTFARLAGAASVAGLPLDGLDAWETIAEGAESPREEVVHSLDVIRVGDWKLIEQDAQYYNWNSGALRLYNINEDPYEETNLADSEAEKITELRERLAYHRPFARDGEAFQAIPDFPPVVYGAEENAAFGDKVQTALEQLDAGNPGPALLRIEVSETSVKLVYDEALDAASEPPADAFTVVVNPGYRSAEVTNVGVSGREVVLTLAMAVAGDNTVGLTYEVPDTGAIQDTDSLEAVGVTWVTGPSDAPPVITTATAALIFVEENETAVATLAATDADHLAEELTWRITGGADRNRFKLTADGVLTFGVAQDYEAPGDSDRDNFYEVTVEVSDGANPVEAVFRVRVTDQREPPGIPEMPSFPGAAADSLTVHWSEPENTGPPITDYDVRYREQGAESFIDGQHEGPGLSLTLDELEPGTIYEVQVRATNDEGTSSWSESGEGMTVTPLTVEMTTDLPPPVEGPFTVRFSFSEPVTGFSANDIEPGQDPACMDDQNTPVLCGPVMGPLETIDGRIFTASVTPGTDQVAHNYTLTLTVPEGRVVAAVGNKPNGAATMDVRIAPPGVTVPISSIDQRTSPGNGQVRLRWNAPANTGGAPIVRYEYRWRESGGEFSEWMRVAPAQRSATVPNLRNGTEYVFEVRAVNALGYGSVETVRTTPSPSTGSGGSGGGGGGGSGGGGGGGPPERPTVNTDPVITTPGPFEVEENQTRVVRIEALDTDPGDAIRSYAIAGGADGNRFSIVAHTGVLSFREPPNFEAPADVGSTDPPSAAGDNEYIVVVRVASGPVSRDRTVEQAFAVRVTDAGRESPGVPDAPRVTLALEASLTVEWAEPENPGPPITDYDVQYREGTSGFFINAPHEGPGRTATLMGLDAATLYQVQVRARNEEGTGRWSEPVEGRTLAGPPAVLPFSVPDRGGISLTSQGTSAELRVGYGQVETAAGMTPPAGLAIFGSRPNGILVSEAGVPASVPLLEGRIFAETNGAVRTGVALANPNDRAATIPFFFTNSEGIDFGHGTFTLEPREQKARFLDEGPFNGGSAIEGTFTFTADLPVAVIALRGFVNERSEFLMTTLPVAPLTVPTTDTVYFPHFAAGGGWTTQVILVNPTHAPISGSVQFFGPGSETEAAVPGTLTLADGRSESTFSYSIPPRSATRLRTSSPAGPLEVGSVRAVPGPGQPAPSGVSIFSFQKDGTTVSEAGVPASSASAAFRLYVEASGTPGQPHSVRSGIALTNTSGTPTTVSLELTDLDGTAAGLPEPLTIPASGHIARFIDEFFPGLPTPFSGILRIASTAPNIAAVGLRLAINPRDDILVTTTPPVDENAAPTASGLFFPHFVDSGGWTTQFILFSGSTGQTASGVIRFTGQDGQPLRLSVVPTTAPTIP